MVAIVSNGIHFKDPWIMNVHTDLAANISLYDTVPNANTAATVAFFTGLSSFGVIDSTNWTANTYKTIYSHTGMGLIYMMIGPTAGGAETTTFEITIDGVLTTVTVTNANGERAMLEAAGISGGTDLNTTNVGWAPAPGVAGGGLDAGLTTTQATTTAGHLVHPMRWHGSLGIAALRYNISALVRMKHSAIINNSTATAYSGVMVRKGIAA